MNKSSLPVATPPTTTPTPNCFIAACLFHNYVTQWRVTQSIFVAIATLITTINTVWQPSWSLCEINNFLDRKNSPGSSRRARWATKQELPSDQSSIILCQKWWVSLRYVDRKALLRAGGEETNTCSGSHFESSSLNEMLKKQSSTEIKQRYIKRSTLS